MERAVPGLPVLQETRAVQEAQERVARQGPWAAPAAWVLRAARATQVEQDRLVLQDPLAQRAILVDRADLDPQAQPAAPDRPDLRDQLD